MIFFSFSLSPSLFCYQCRSAFGTPEEKTNYKNQTEIYRKPNISGLALWSSLFCWCLFMAWKMCFFSPLECNNFQILAKVLEMIGFWHSSMKIAWILLILPISSSFLFEYVEFVTSQVLPFNLLKARGSKRGVFQVLHKHAFYYSNDHYWLY